MLLIFLEANKELKWSEILIFDAFLDKYLIYMELYVFINYNI